MREIGIDIVENKRIKMTSDFIEKILTDKERDIFNSKKGHKQLEFLCGRFAAKEAIIKCLSKQQILNPLEIEITNDDIGRPVAVVHNFDVSISIAHEKNYSVAIAINNK